ALTDNPTKPKLAMTGEITLQGRVLAIGGLKEKLLAAKQHGFTTVIVPQENFDDIQDIKKDDTITDSLTIIFVKTMDEVLTHAFIENPLTKKATVKKKPSTRKATVKK